MPSDPASNPSRPRVAIVGGGISGIACSWELVNSYYTVDLYETDVRLGGHANSVPSKGNGRNVVVDTGFIAIDEPTYPQFCNFLSDIGVQTISTDMSFGVSTTDEDGFQWSSHSIWTFVGRLSNLFNIHFWKLVLDIIWFALFAQDILHEEPLRSDRPTDRYCTGTDKSEEPLEPVHYESIGSYLKRKGYSISFINFFLIPMIASPWCTDPDEFAQTFPARLIIQFMLEHGMIDAVLKTLRWRSFKNGSKTYVDAFQEYILPHHRIYLNTTVTSVTRSQNGVILQLSNGDYHHYNHVVLAIHANQALRILGENATTLERRILSNFKTSENVCYLHSDTSFLPSYLPARAAWNCFLERRNHAATVSGCEVPQRPGCRISITFDMNKLQAIPFPGEPGSPGRVLVTMNPSRTPDMLQGSYTYSHPLISAESVTMSRHLSKINGVDKISFAGAWMGFGFHEDGYAAGVHAARVIVLGHENMDALDLFYGTRHYSVKPGFVRLVLRISFLVLRWITQGLSQGILALSKGCLQH
ncbi:hypothetical protein M434DRAFT_75307 [Hypoxylon sp. CO27-5]|nr:hypothetical protein M434DRAFT_75307 [Hypoxylon sp. CO27-5]